MAHALEPVTVSMIAKWLGVSRQRADQLTRTKGFPEPAWQLERQRVWRFEDVWRWALANGRLKSSA